MGRILGPDPLICGEESPLLRLETFPEARILHWPPTVWAKGRTARATRKDSAWPQQTSLGTHHFTKSSTPIILTAPRAVTASHLHMNRKRLDRPWDCKTHSYGQGSIWNTGLLIPQLMFLFHFPSLYKCITSSWTNFAKYRKTWNVEM